MIDQASILPYIVVGRRSVNKIFNLRAPDDIDDPYMDELIDRIGPDLLSYHDNRRYAIFLAALVMVPTAILMALHCAIGGTTSFLFLFCAITGIWSTYWGYIGHDFAHGAGFKDTRLNKVMAHFSWALAGYGYSAWDLNHNRIHHINREDIDEIRYSEISDAGLPAILALMRTVVKQTIQVFPASLLVATILKNRDSILSAVLSTLVNAARLWVIYALAGGFNRYFALGLLVHMLAAFLLFAVTFTVGHANSNLMFYDDEIVPWTKYQINGTQTIGGGPLTSFIMGLCLRYQIEHHLFPGVSSFNYPEISKHVREFVSEKEDLIYTSNSLLTALMDMVTKKRYSGPNL